MATTYAVTLGEETARRFEETAASLDMEPSEALCRLVRGFVKTGGFAGDGEATDGESLPGLTLEEQAREWRAMRASRDGGAPVANVGSATSQQPSRSDASEGTRTPLPWEDLATGVAPWQSSSTTKLPWED